MTGQTSKNQTTKTQPTKNQLTKAMRIAVIDDHAIVQYGYSQLINHQPDMEVCGLASSEQEGIELVSQQRPDLAIVDLSLKEGHGIDLIKMIVKATPEIKILVISAHDESLFAERVLSAGASGYINKQEATERLIEGIRTLLDGEFYFSQIAMKHLLGGRLGQQKRSKVGGVESLTDRELHVFEQIGSGSSTREIADKMYLSVKTIERYKENIKQKLRIENATQLVQRATQWVFDRGC